MRRITLVCAALAVSWLAGPSCSCTHQSIPRAYPAPTVEQLLTHVRQGGESARSYKAESKMDYWVGDQRIKATVLVMGERGSKAFFKAMNPATDTSAADLVCNGQNFVFVDYEHNCQLSGQCDRRAIGQLLRVSMAPDDFLLLAVGSVPIIPDPTGTVRWDEKRGAEVVELVSRDRAWRQTLVLDGRGGAGKWDVLESVVTDGAGRGGLEAAEQGLPRRPGGRRKDDPRAGRDPLRAAQAEGRSTSEVGGAHGQREPR